jgi:seryl-tRNA synthetase
MLPLELIRKEPDRVKRAAELKGEGAPIDEILALDADWRRLLTEAESTKAEQNALSKQFGQSKDQSLVRKMKELAEQSKARMAEAEERKAKLDDLLLYVPNLFHESVPVGKSEADNVVLREWGDKREFDFAPRTHYDLGERLGIMDFEHSAKIAGSRFAALSGIGARLERALVQFMLDVHTTEHGYTEMFTPFLVNSDAMIGTANLPKFGDQAFRLADRDLWLVPTAEVPLTNWHRDEILDGRELPIRYVMYSPCWRSEAGAAGKDTRGYIRLHQFSKVEMVRITTDETSLEELDTLTGHAEVILQKLGLPYRVLAMCTGDMGFAQYKKYDLEAWCPGLDRHLEVSSCSAFNDFQARRANLRYRPEPGAPPRFAHTINGSGLALTRTIDAVIENYQAQDGSITIPDALRPYMGGAEKIA